MSDDIWSEYKWYTLKEAAAYLGVEDKKIRSMIKDYTLLAIRREENESLQIPEPFMTASGGTVGILDSLQGTARLLFDCGFTKIQAVEWLLQSEESLGSTPIAALIAGRKKEVRRVAGALAL